MIRLAAEAAKVRLDAATALLEACEGRHYPATEIRSAYLFDVFRPVPADMADMAAELDRDAA